VGRYSVNPLDLPPQRVVEVLEEALAATYGEYEFDEKTPWGGLRRGLIYGIAGEFGAGKSMFAMQ
jgi:RecA/RadA recombinase